MTSKSGPLWVLVRTLVLDKVASKLVLEEERAIDHNQHGDRVWLSKHQYWALRNGRVIVLSEGMVKEQ